MKHLSQPGKQTHPRTGTRRSVSTERRTGISVAPAQYGIDFVDHSPSSIGGLGRASVSARSMPAPVLQGQFTGTSAVTQREQPWPSGVSRTGLPQRLKAGIEALSGMDLSDITVHVNSQDPARLSALAYAQGNDIHLAPGQERHLPHEAWHIVQQRQGRVTPTIHAGNLSINADRGLEQEASVMGARALAASATAQPSGVVPGPPGGTIAHSGVATPAAGQVLQRILDEKFGHGGTPQGSDTKTCQEFAKKVSDPVDQAYFELLSGNVKGWNGAKFATFAKLLMEDNPYAVPHVGNAVEERVYALMKAVDMGVKCTPQFTEGMGGTSYPDIVINLADDREGLVDITSDRGHILGKAGAWTTSTRYVYVAEAWFPSVTEDDIPDIKAAFQKGGVSLKEALEAKAKADEVRKQKFEARQKELAEARELYNQYPSLSAFVEDQFEGSRSDAFAWMRAHGLGSAKGVPKLKGKRKPSEVTRVAMKKKARKVKVGKIRVVEGRIRDAIVGLKEYGGSDAKSILKYINANYDAEMTAHALRVDLLRGEKKGLWKKVSGGLYKLG